MNCMCCFVCVCGNQTVCNGVIGRVTASHTSPSAKTKHPLKTSPQLLRKCSTSLIFSPRLFHFFDFFCNSLPGLRFHIPWSFYRAGCYVCVWM